MAALSGKRILITCGPTWVAIDDVRVLSNRSTGELGRILAGKLKAAGAKVTVLEGPVTEPLKDRSVKVLKFSFFEELAALLNKELKQRYDAVIHAAAVSDFQLKKRFKGKIQSGAGTAGRSPLRLDFVPTPKLINRIKKISPRTFLVGFKLESDFDHPSVMEEAKKLFSAGRCDLVVANFFGSNGYEAFILDRERTLLGKVKGKHALAGVLVDLLKQKL
jgi:phosphopantothenoylcysteine decarboxylase/phosphopantothenate--cysteine ligase